MPKIIAKKEDWISLGYTLFSEHGISGIVVEKMATILKVNKSSFYWHFTTKKGFIDEMIHYWVRIGTNEIIDHTNKEISVGQQFKTLVKLSFKKDPHIDFIFFLKRYALNDKGIQKIIDDIDRERIKYTEGLLVDMGYSKVESKTKAILFYKYLIGYHEMIRYKEQSGNYHSQVKKELNQFIEY